LIFLALFLKTLKVIKNQAGFFVGSAGLEKTNICKLHANKQNITREMYENNEGWF